MMQCNTTADWNLREHGFFTFVKYAAQY